MPFAGCAEAISIFGTSFMAESLALDGRERRSRHQLALLLDHVTGFRIHLEILQPFRILEQSIAPAIAVCRILIHPDMDVAVDVAGLAHKPSQRLAVVPLLRDQAMLLVERELLAQRADADGIGAVIDQHGVSPE